MKGPGVPTKGGRLFRKLFLGTNYGRLSVLRLVASALNSSIALASFDSVKQLSSNDCHNSGMKQATHFGGNIEITQADDKDNTYGRSRDPHMKGFLQQNAGSNHAKHVSKHYDEVNVVIWQILHSALKVADFWFRLIREAFGDLRQGIRGLLAHGGVGIDQ